MSDLRYQFLRFCISFLIYYILSVQALDFNYHKIVSSNTSRLEAHVGIFRLLMKGIFGHYVL